MQPLKAMVDGLKRAKVAMFCSPAVVSYRQAPPNISMRQAPSFLSASASYDEQCVDLMKK